MTHEGQKWSIPDFAFSSDRTLQKLSQFGGVYESLNLLHNDFAGAVLMAGVGPLFPERVFVCSPESNFKQLLPEVTKLVCCEANYEVFEDIPAVKVSSQNQGIEYIPGDMWTVLKRDKQTYDAITFCRIPDLPRQLGEGRIFTIIDKLNPGGIALLSGSRFYDNYDINEIAESIAMQRKIAGVEVQELVDTADGMNTGNGGHFGVVIRMAK
jgi:hypothetical protein